jgi:hypothetical protein
MTKTQVQTANDQISIQSAATVAYGVSIAA